MCIPALALFAWTLNAEPRPVLALVATHFDRLPDPICVREGAK
jgi:hypothetical protein